MTSTRMKRKSDSIAAAEARSAYDEAQERKRLALVHACYPEATDSDYLQLGIGYDLRQPKDDSSEQHPGFVHRELSGFGYDQLLPGNDPIGFDYDPLGFGYEQIVGSSLSGSSGFDYGGLGGSYDAYENADDNDGDSEEAADNSDGDTDVEGASSEQPDDSSFESKPSSDGHMVVPEPRHWRAQYRAPVPTSTGLSAPKPSPSSTEEPNRPTPETTAVAAPPAPQPDSKTSSGAHFLWRREVLLLVTLLALLVSALTQVWRPASRPTIHVIKSESSFAAKRGLSLEIEKLLDSLDSSLRRVEEGSLKDLQRVALGLNGVASKLGGADLASRPEAVEQFKQAQADLNELALLSSEEEPSEVPQRAAEVIQKGASALREINSAINPGSRTRASAISETISSNPQSRLKPLSGGLQSHLELKVASLLEEDEELVMSAEHILKNRKVGGSMDDSSGDIPENLSPVAVDHAVSIRGGKVVSERSTPTSPPYVSSLNPLQYVKHVVGPLKAHTDPRIVINHMMPALGSDRSFLHQCYCFKGAEGSISIEFQQPVALEVLELFHLRLAESKRAYKGAVPRNFSVRGSLSDGGVVDLGSFSYSNSPGFEELQSFPVDSSRIPVKAVTLDFKSNGGAPMTCVYRVRAVGRAIVSDSDSS